MKTIMKKIDFWSVMEMMTWIMTALWGVLVVIGFFNLVIDHSMTVSYEWFFTSVVAALAIRGFRRESH